MNEELTAKEVMEIVEEIHNEHSYCVNCPFEEEFGDRFSKVIEICKKWKANHAEIKSEWVHVCRIIEDTGNIKRCVYEQDIEEDEILPFDTYDKIAEDILKEYCKNHEGNFFATVERICRKVVR